MFHDTYAIGLRLRAFRVREYDLFLLALAVVKLPRLLSRGLPFLCATSLPATFTPAFFIVARAALRLALRFFCAGLAW
jgi:predicted cobalt transporter CbtA